MTEAMWIALWRMLVPDAEWHPDWAVEKYWKVHSDELGVPTQKIQQPGEWRLFSKGKILRWRNGQIEVLP